MPVPVSHEALSLAHLIVS